MEEKPLHISCLPDEMICLILQKTSCRGILNFRSTCKHYNELVNTNPWIWKGHFTELLPSTIVEIVTQYDHGNWLNAMKRYFTIKRSIIEELQSMSPKFYARTDELRLGDLQFFFKLGTTHSESYHYMIHILLDLIKVGNEGTLQNYNGKEINLTHLYYANIVVRFLMHTFLAVKWARDFKKNELTADLVLNFLVQWIDPCELRSQADFDTCMSYLVKQIEGMFPENPDVKTLPEKIAKGLVDELKVLEAISDVIQIQQSNPTGGPNLLQGLRNRNHNLLASAVLYQAVARGCGVKCELYAFRNHLFLEWEDPNKKIYRIEPQTGLIVPQSVCPYVTTNFRDGRQYEPAAFIKYIASSFLMSMMDVSNTLTQNATWLIDLITNSHDVENIYCDFLPYTTSLLDFERDPDLAQPLNLEYLNPSHVAVLEKLSKLERTDSIPPFIREIVVRPHGLKIQYAVGMVCFHKALEYICVVRDWHMQYAPDWQQRLELHSLEHGLLQPFYSVIALDQSERYLPQECIIPADRPKRLIHMENVLGKEFSHFDGFAYVPNEEKLKEYPEDGPIREMYRTKARR